MYVRENIKNEILEYIDIYFDTYCKKCETCCVEMKQECLIRALFYGESNIFGVKII